MKKTEDKPLKTRNAKGPLSGFYREHVTNIMPAQIGHVAAGYTTLQSHDSATLHQDPGKKEQPSDSSIHQRQHVAKLEKDRRSSASLKTSPKLRQTQTQIATATSRLLQSTKSTACLHDYPMTSSSNPVLVQVPTESLRSLEEMERLTRECTDLLRNAYLPNFESPLGFLPSISKTSGANGDNRSSLPELRGRVTTLEREVQEEPNSQLQPFGKGDIERRLYHQRKSVGRNSGRGSEQRHWQGQGQEQGQSRDNRLRYCGSQLANLQLASGQRDDLPRNITLNIHQNFYFSNVLSTTRRLEESQSPGLHNGKFQSHPQPRKAFSSPLNARGQAHSLSRIPKIFLERPTPAHVVPKPSNQEVRALKVSDLGKTAHFQQPPCISPLEVETSKLLAAVPRQQHLQVERDYASNPSKQKADIGTLAPTQQQNFLRRLEAKIQKYGKQTQLPSPAVPSWDYGLSERGGVPNAKTQRKDQNEENADIGNVTFGSPDTDS